MCFLYVLFEKPPVGVARPGRIKLYGINNIYIYIYLYTYCIYYVYLHYVYNIYIIYIYIIYIYLLLVEHEAPVGVAGPEPRHRVPPRLPQAQPHPPVLQHPHRPLPQFDHFRV